MRCQFERKRCVAAAIFPESLTVEPYGGSGHDSAEVNEHAALTQFKRHWEVPAINRYKLILLVIESMPRQELVRVRNGDSLESSVVESGSSCIWLRLFAVKPVVIEGKHSTQRPGCVLSLITSGKFFQQGQSSQS